MQSSLPDILVQTRRELSALERRLARQEARFQETTTETALPAISNAVVDFSTGDCVITWDAALEGKGVTAYQVRVIKTYT